MGLRHAESAYRCRALQGGFDLHRAAARLFRDPFQGAWRQGACGRAYRLDPSDSARRLPNFRDRPHLPRSSARRCRARRARPAQRRNRDADHWWRRSRYWRSLEGNRYGTKVYFTTHAYLGADNPAPAVKEFRAAFARAYPGKEPDAFAALGYDAARLLMAAIESAVSTEPQAVHEAIARTKDFPGVTGNITFAAENRIPLKSVTIMQVDSGGQKFEAEILPRTYRRRADARCSNDGASMRGPHGSQICRGSGRRRKSATNKKKGQSGGHSAQVFGRPWRSPRALWRLASSGVGVASGGRRREGALASLHRRPISSCAAGLWIQPRPCKQSGSNLSSKATARQLANLPERASSRARACTAVKSRSNLASLCHEGKSSAGPGLTAGTLKVTPNDPGIVHKDTGYASKGRSLASVRPPEKA